MLIISSCIESVCADGHVDVAEAAKPFTGVAPSLRAGPLLLCVRPAVTVCLWRPLSNSFFSLPLDVALLAVTSEHM